MLLRRIRNGLAVALLPACQLRALCTYKLARPAHLSATPAKPSCRSEQLWLVRDHTALNVHSTHMQPLVFKV